MPPRRRGGWRCAIPSTACADSPERPTMATIAGMVRWRCCRARMSCRCVPALRRDRSRSSSARADRTMWTMWCDPARERIWSGSVGRSSQGRILPGASSTRADLPGAEVGGASIRKPEGCSGTAPNRCASTGFRPGAGSSRNCGNPGEARSSGSRSRGRFPGAQAAKSPVPRVAERERRYGGGGGGARLGSNCCLFATNLVPLSFFGKRSGWAFHVERFHPGVRPSSGLDFGACHDPPIRSSDAREDCHPSPCGGMPSV